MSGKHVLERNDSDTYTILSRITLEQENFPMPDRLRKLLCFSCDTLKAHGIDVAAVYNDGLSFHRNGDLNRAELSYRQVLEINPNHPGAIHHLGAIFLVNKDYDKAIAWMERSLTLDGTNPIFFNNYGAALRDSGKREAATPMFRRAISLKPDYADAWSNLGQAQLDARQFADAEISFREALRFSLDHRDASLRLIDLFMLTNRHDDAVTLTRRMLSKYPRDFGFVKVWADIHCQTRRWNEALEAFARIDAAHPNNPETLSKLGHVHAELNDFDKSKAYYSKAASLDKRRTLAQYKYLGICPAVFPDMESVNRYWNFLEREIDEATKTKIPVDWRTSPTEGVLPSFHLAHHGRCCRSIREKFASLYRGAFPHEKPKFVLKERIRVGFFTSHGNEGGLLRGTAGIIEHLDPSRFEPVIFCADSSEERCRRPFGSKEITTILLPNGFDTAAEIVRKADCDIIYYWKVEPGTWNPFFAMTKPAPIQCTSWGTLGTSGFDAVDYYLTSPFMEPENVDITAHYTETVEMLATFPMFQPPSQKPDGVNRNEFDLPSKGAIYFCPHRISKYHPSFDVLLKRILENDQKGTLVIKTGEESTASEQLMARMRINLGESLMKRVKFMGHLSHTQYMRLFSLATTVLDSPVFTGGYTAYDAFSLGVPMVTMPGSVGVQTFTAGFYRKMQMPEMVMRTPEDYVDQAVKLGIDEGYREAVSKTIEERSGSLFNEKLAVREFERFFEKAIEKESK